MRIGKEAYFHGKFLVLLMSSEFRGGMETILLFLRILFWIFLSITILGMIKPWWVLWFLDFKNRMSVLKYYGSITLLLGLALFLANQIV